MCFGDGSVMPYITKPEVNTVTIPSTVTPGTTSITVNALAGSYVAVTDNSSVIYGVGVANTSGVATVNFTNAITATGGGNVTADGGGNVTARGICWSTSQNPTIAGSHTTNGTGTGSFTSSMTGLTANTTYYVRAYATNSAGTAYGEEVSFTTLPDGIPGDVDGNGNLTMYDITLILRHCAGGTQLSGQALLNADLNGDGNVTMYDATLLLRAIVNQ